MGTAEGCRLDGRGCLGGGKAGSQLLQRKPVDMTFRRPYSFGELAGDLTVRDDKRIMKNFALFAVLAALSLGGTAVANAKEASVNKEAVKSLAKVPAAELPAVAASFVTSTPKESRGAAVDAVVRKVARVQPAALRHVVAAVAKADPSLAVRAAGVAAKASPQSVGAIATAACTAAPEKAAQVLALCADLSSVSRTSLAELVASSNPSFSADTLARDAASVDVSADAAVVTGGTVILPLNPPPGAIGTDLNGNPVFTAPSAVGPGVPGEDPDRYASAGS